ncbi:MAG: peptidoglycan D,D-transpeptidase FtsI family protein [Hyphomicrobiaceae bacterium]
MANISAAGNTPRIYDQDRESLRSSLGRTVFVCLSILVAFGAVSVQLVRLALVPRPSLQAAPAGLASDMFSRPDVVDRKGRLLATDVGLPTLFADPFLIADADETLEKLATVYRGVNTLKNRRALVDTRRRYHLLRRGVTPALAQKIHDLGLPGIAFKWEPKRSYPGGRLAGHVLGYVNGNNRGVTGIERYMNTQPGVERAFVARVNTAQPLSLALDMRAQFGLEQELIEARKKHQAAAAIGIVIDVETGEIPAAASVPGVDPSLTDEVLAKTRRNRLTNDVYELGSVFKIITMAMSLDLGTVSPAARIRVDEALEIGGYVIRDKYLRKPKLSLTEVFVRSSNVGAAILAQATGAEKQRKFLEKLGLTTAIRRPDLQTVSPLLPKKWGEVETATIGYGHGIAVTPMHLAVAMATIVNGGYEVIPTYLSRSERRPPKRRRVLSSKASKLVRQMLRANVILGTGRAADVPGYAVGGKTGTADVSRGGRYDGSSVITSFAAAFPIDQPAYVVLVTLFDPAPNGRGNRTRAAAKNAAPLAGRVIARLAPLLGVSAKSQP